MNPGRASAGGIRLSARNIGGIDETTVSFDTGVTILTGRNATNRTSFLSALMTALGSDRVSLKGDSEEGSVELAIGEQRFGRSLHRRGQSVSFDGEPYLADSETADLFAFLLERNEARDAVRYGRDLREIMMRPIDSASIQAEIEGLRERRAELDERLESITALGDQLPDLRAEQTRLDERIEETTAKLEAVEAELAEPENLAPAATEEDEQLGQTLSTLGTVRSGLEETRYEQETQQRSLEALAAEREQLQERLEGLEPVPDGATRQIEQRLDELRREQSRLTAAVSDLQSVIQYNEEMLSESGGVSAALREAAGETATEAGRRSESPTDQLVEAGEQTIVCWTCGTDVTQDAIGGTIDRLRSLQQADRDRIEALGDRVESLEAERDELEDRRDTREAATRDLERVEREIEHRESRQATLQEHREEYQTRIEELTAAVETFEREDRSELLERHQEAKELEFELRRLEDERSAIEADIAESESAEATRGSIERDREQVTAELTELRTRIERIEKEAVEAFNTEMEAVLGVLEYENLERIWIERTVDQRPGGEFELQIVRSTSEGVAYADAVENLSESEREVTGLVFALAGYLVHEVYEQLPFLVLDSLEAIDSPRIAILVEYLAEYAENLVVALLPEDERALDDSHERVEQI
jgi:DNA repair exonuclease SbcCD ATPase subunit